MDPYNPGFEVGLVYWSGTSAFVDGSDPGAGGWSVRHDTSFGNSWNVLANPSGSFAVASPGTSYVLSVLSRQTLMTNSAPPVEARAWFGLRESNASSVTVLYNWMAAHISTTWRNNYLTVTPDVNTSRLTVYLRTDMAAATGSAWWDGVRLDYFPNAFINDSNRSLQVRLPELVFNHDGMSVNPANLTPVAKVGSNLVGGTLSWKLTRAADGFDSTPIAQDVHAITQAGTFQWNINMSHLAEGKYDLTISTATSDGSEVGVLRKPLAVLSNVDTFGQTAPVAITSSEIDADGRLLVNGDPFQAVMLYGVYSGSSADYARIRQLGFNSIKITGNSVATLSANVDLAWSHGLYSWVVLSQPPITNGSVGPSTAWNSTNLQQAVNSLKTKPGLLGWDLVDEPDGHDVVPSRVQDAYDLIKSADPGHVVWVNLTNNPAIAANYPDCSDFASYDTYPFPFGDFSGVDSRNTFIRQLYPGKPLISVLQGFAAAGFPSFSQLRALVYNSVCDGMVNLFYYTWLSGQYNGLKNQPEMASYTRLLNWELSQLFPELSAPLLALPVTVSNPNVKSMAIATSTGTLLILVNQSETPIAGVTAIVGSAAFSSSQGRFPGTSNGTMSNGVLSDDLPAYGVGVYVLQ
jgi:hypothetical protein